MKGLIQDGGQGDKINEGRGGVRSRWRDGWHQLAYLDKAEPNIIFSDIFVILTEES